MLVLHSILCVPCSVIGWYSSSYVLFLLLAGRLESPNPLVRKMAGSVALAFSKVIDPKNPLYLDDSCSGDIIDWEFGLATADKGNLDTSDCTEKDVLKSKASISAPERDLNHTANRGISNNVKSKTKKLSEFKFVDPDEIIDPVTLNNELGSDIDDDDDDNASENSESSSDSSLQPYDLSDDDTDLKRKFSQLVDVVGALRKSDDVDGVRHLSSSVIFSQKIPSKFYKIQLCSPIDPHSSAICSFLGLLKFVLTDNFSPHPIRDANRVNLPSGSSYLES